MTESADLLYDRARAFTLRGEDDAAKTELLKILSIDAAHFGALTDLAALALKTGHRSAALTAYRQAARHHPKNPRGLVNLANVLLEDEAIGDAKGLYLSALAIDPALVYAHQGLAVALDKLGDWAQAEKHRELGYKNHSLVTRPYRGTGVPLRVLLLVSALGGNIPTNVILDDRLFAVTALYADYFDPNSPLPEHDVVFNAIGDSDLCGRALTNAEIIAGRCVWPLVNPPRLIGSTGRLAIAARLSALPDVVAPRMRLYARKCLEAPNASSVLERDGFCFPLLARSPGFHTGQNFIRVEHGGGLRDAVAQLAGSTLLAIEFLDAQGQDGLTRKYRAMFIDGQIYPLHLALSRSWKVHYFTSAMAQDEAFRREEDTFLSNMADAIGARAMRGLRQIQEILGLDYGGADFAIARDGRLLLFEANATMAMVPPPADTCWDYRRAPIARGIESARNMLFERGRRCPSGRPRSNESKTAPVPPAA